MRGQILDPQPEQLHKIEITQYTSAPLRVYASMQSPQPPEEAFDLWVNRASEVFADVAPIEYFAGGRRLGLALQAGATHRKILYKGKRLVEHIPGFEVGRYFAYSAAPEESEMKFPIKNHLGLLTFEPSEAGGSMVAVRQYYTLRIHIAALLVTWGFKRGIRDMMTQIAHRYGGQLL